MLAPASGWLFHNQANIGRVRGARPACSFSDADEIDAEAGCADDTGILANKPRSPGRRDYPQPRDEQVRHHHQLNEYASPRAAVNLDEKVTFGRKSSRPRVCYRAPERSIPNVTRTCCLALVGKWQVTNLSPHCRGFFFFFISF